jgi:hypothetical protein
MSYWQSTTSGQSISDRFDDSAVSEHAVKALQFGDALRDDLAALGKDVHLAHPFMRVDAKVIDG